jgi:hypothetical protein
MTANQLKYWTLQEERRHNKEKEAADRISAEGAKLRGQGAMKQADVAAKLEEKEINHNVWDPLKTISDNTAKVLGGIL